MPNGTYGGVRGIINLYSIRCEGGAKTGKNDGSKMKKTRCAAICFCAPGLCQKREKENAQRMASLSGSSLSMCFSSFLKLMMNSVSVVRTAIVSAIGSARKTANT